MSPRLAENVMLTIPGNARIFLSASPTDLRKGFHSLCLVVQESFQEDVTSGSLFVFLNRQCDRMKVLYWDGDGLVIWYKRLEKGSFPRKNVRPPLLTRREFLLLLEGVTPKRFHPRLTLA